MPRSCTVDLERDPAAPHAARRLVRLLLPQWGLDDPGLVDDASLVVSELVTNAVLHGGDHGGGLTLGLQLERELVLWVADAHPGVPAQREAQPDAESGRGLDILSRLAARWGVEPTTSGKRVHATLRVEAEHCA